MIPYLCSMSGEYPCVGPDNCGPATDDNNEYYYDDQRNDDIVREEGANASLGGIMGATMLALLVDRILLYLFNLALYLFLRWLALKGYRMARFLLFLLFGTCKSIKFIN